MQQYKVGLVAALLLGLGVAACEPANNAAVRSGDGRERLSTNNSYGEFGEFVVHVNAMITAGLTPEVAQSYGITRSENTGLVNLVVLRKSNDVGQDNPVKAAIELSAANLTGQLKPVEIREVEDSSSIYYIGVVSIDDQETINFDFDVRPEGSDRTLLVRFSHKFYIR